MADLLLFASGLIAGVAIGAWAAWQQWLRDEKPVVNVTLVADKNFANKIDSVVVSSWLDQRGLTWQPKGAVFELNKDGRK